MMKKTKQKISKNDDVKTMIKKLKIQIENMKKNRRKFEEIGKKLTELELLEFSENFEKNRKKLKKS